MACLLVWNILLQSTSQSPLLACTREADLSSGLNTLNTKEISIWMSTFTQLKARVVSGLTTLEGYATGGHSLLLPVF